MVPRRPDLADADRIRTAGRGIAFTRTAFAYPFQTRRTTLDSAADRVAPAALAAPAVVRGLGWWR